MPSLDAVAIKARVKELCERDGTSERAAIIKADLTHDYLQPSRRSRQDGRSHTLQLDKVVRLADANGWDIGELLGFGGIDQVLLEKVLRAVTGDPEKARLVVELYRVCNDRQHAGKSVDDSFIEGFVLAHVRRLRPRAIGGGQ